MIDMKRLRYKSANYTVAIQVAKSPAAVFSHLIHDISKFWPEEFEGKSTQLNDEFIFRTGDGHYSKNRIVELVPGKKVTWLVTESMRRSDNFDWTGSRMIFELTPGESSTLLEFTYDGPILEEEHDRLLGICDRVIKNNLYNLIMNNSFTTSIEVAGSPQYVFDCIKEVPKWWSTDYQGSSSRLNDEFIIYHPGAHFSKQKLVEVIPCSRMVWLVTDSTLDWLQKDKHEWTNTKMVFELTPRGDRTLLRFTHEGLVPEKECYSRCEQGWTTVILVRLSNYINEGVTI